MLEQAQTSTRESAAESFGQEGHMLCSIHPSSMHKSRPPDRQPASMRPPEDDAPRPAAEERRAPAGATTSVRLTRKYADMIDGVDLTDAKVGDELDLPQHDADVLVAEGWAERSPRRQSNDLRSRASETSASKPRHRR
jgi:hypothetical protein